MTDPRFPLPGLDRGQRIVASVIEARARRPSDRPWVSIPVNDQDLSQGYKDLSFWQLNNYANHAAQWLSENLPPTTEKFQCFAYAGPKDLRYPILAVAAAKLQKVMVMPSPLIPPPAQMRIFNAKGCSIYLRPASLTDQVAKILQDAPQFQVLTVPEIEEFMNDEEAPSFVYPKTWEEGHQDPWMVFHSSGTTGNPKPLTWTQNMAATTDIMASQPDLEESVLHRFAKSRWYTPLPSLHVVGTMMVLAMTTFLETTLVIGPPILPTASLIVDLLHYGRVDGAFLTPALTEEMCLTDGGLKALRNLKFLHYGGAPLSNKTGEKLISHIQVVPTVGSSEAGLYLTRLHDKWDAWEYISFQKHACAKLEHRFGGLHELVFVRQPDTMVPMIFQMFPDRDRYESSDMLVEHPMYKGLWKLIGRSDDWLSFSHGDGMHASLVEPDIEAHPAIKSALIGENGRPAPVLLVELLPGVVAEDGKDHFLASLLPYIERANERCHDCVKLSSARLIVAPKEKPFVRSIKGNVVRLLTLELYKDEIAAVFE
ncbi:AMP-binding enzyme [Penicillium macrosclerotiorum]|uniref:AMP-binding enzyme n=1 Tax=Penicillium macrosclerotiorum TaxID=303699 RepID=UPI002546D34E|nr:AMP-binding enzyme [Penicillium macrosclerotiorum]KAJ5679304.1 AMP-binding enzyme [Penicillium macrosclerotiorum]